MSTSTYLDGMVEKDTMHGFSDQVHPSEGEGEVGQTPTHTGTRQCVLHGEEYILTS